MSALPFPSQGQRVAVSYYQWTPLILAIAAFLFHLPYIVWHIMSVSSGVRRNGAAALDLAWVAAGRLDGFWEKGLSLWDIAAGVLLVREAGGFISDFASRDKALDSGDVVAANPSIHGELIRKLRD